ncbi:MAG: hypothetical protein JWQ40_542 [Segetibacter sp.]|nr:hypothetical protein [Segetibacter sp.]
MVIIRYNKNDLFIEKYILSALESMHYSTPICLPEKVLEHQGTK